MIWVYLFVGLYVAPEIYNGDVFDRSVDAYAFGLVVYEVPVFCTPIILLIFNDVLYPIFTIF